MRALLVNNRIIADNSGITLSKPTNEIIWFPETQVFCMHVYARYSWFAEKRSFICIIISFMEWDKVIPFFTKTVKSVLSRSILPLGVGPISARELNWDFCKSFKIDTVSSIQKQCESFLKCAAPLLYNIIREAKTGLLDFHLIPDKPDKNIEELC